MSLPRKRKDLLFLIVSADGIIFFNEERDMLKPLALKVAALCPNFCLPPIAY